MTRFWKNRKVLVVGGAGFIGSHTVDALILRGARVAIVDDLSTGMKENCNPKARFYKLNAASIPGLSKVFKKEKPDFVMIFSSIVDVPTAIARPLSTAEGIATTINVLEHSVRHNVKKVLYASSGFIYGNARKIPTPETEPFQPLNPYNIAKATSEYYLKFFHEHYRLPYVALRYAPVYGPRRTIGPIFDYIRNISAGKRAKLYGTKTRDYIYVEDVARANLIAMQKYIADKDPIYNIGTGKEIRLDALYAFIAKLLQKPNNIPVKKESRSAEVDRFALDIRKARRVLGFRPHVSLIEGLRETIAWVKGMEH